MELHYWVEGPSFPRKRESKRLQHGCPINNFGQDKQTVFVGSDYPAVLCYVELNSAQEAFQEEVPQFK